MSDKLFDNMINLLSKNMDLRSARHDIIANNIANIDTPNYKAIDLKFEKELNEAIGRNTLPLSTTTGNHISPANNTISNVQPSLEFENNTTMRNDLNDVDIEQEMSKLAENSLHYNISSSSLFLKLKMLTDSIKGGK